MILSCKGNPGRLVNILATTKLSKGVNNQQSLSQLQKQRRYVIHIFALQLQLRQAECSAYLIYHIAPFPLTPLILYNMMPCPIHFIQEPFQLCHFTANLEWFKYNVLLWVDRMGVCGLTIGAEKLFYFTAQILNPVSIDKWNIL